MEDFVSLPFINYVNSDKSIYPFASKTIDPRTNKFYIDDDNDFRLGNSGGFLMNIDFTFVNTYLFSQAADNYIKNKSNPNIVEWVNNLELDKDEPRGKYYYCPHKKGTKEYIDFWSEETYRRKNGITFPCKKLRDGTVVDLHITGDHYNYLNYSRIDRTPNEKEKKELLAKGDKKTTLITAFPRFWDGDYWNFKIDLFVALNSFHLGKGKARGKGYSNKRGSQGANTLNLIPSSIVILAAYLIDYLTDTRATADMVKRNLDWLENNTYWRRGYISESLDNIELGYRSSTGGAKKHGWKSALFSVSLMNNESAAIGKRAIEIDFEEAGKLPNLQKALDVTLSSTEVGASNIGTIRVYGTAGTKSANWAPFANVFFNPLKNKMMPFENVWDYNKRHALCGFFHPQILNMEPFIDVDGNSDLIKAQLYDYEDKKKQEKELSTSEYIVYVAQRANSPEEAFKSGGDNLFSSIELSNHVAKVISSPELRFYRDGTLIEDSINALVFKTNAQLRHTGLSDFAHPYIEDVPFDTKEDFYGCIREYYPPFKINNEVVSNLYYVTIDPVAKDKKSNTVINKNSLISIQVLMFSNNYANTSGDIIVAAYCGRPPRMVEGDKILLKLCEYYNAKAIVETDRGETVQNFRKWGKLNRLYKDPTVILSNKQVESRNAPYGINTGSGQNATDGLLYLYDWLYTKRSVDEFGNVIYTFHYISDIPLLKELIQYNDSGNFDRISSLKNAMFVNKAIQVKKKRDIISLKRKNRKSIYDEIGLYS